MTVVIRGHQSHTGAGYKLSPAPVDARKALVGARVNYTPGGDVCRVFGTRLFSRRQVRAAVAATSRTAFTASDFCGDRLRWSSTPPAVNACKQSRSGFAKCFKVLSGCVAHVEQHIERILQGVVRARQGFGRE